MSDPGFRIGLGSDCHRLVEGRPLLIGGVELPSERGALAHSDGDALLHAIADALLGAVACGDIGVHFPDTDPTYENLDSCRILEHALQQVHGGGFEVVNVDCVVSLETPKLGPHRAAIRASLAELLGVGVERVSLKAETAEALGPVGRGAAIETLAVVLLGPGS